MMQTTLGPWRTSDRSARSDRVVFGIEPLEPRVLLSATLDIATGLLTIEGTENNDAITVSAGGAPGDVRLQGVDGVDNGTVFSGVNGIEISSLGGNDKITIRKSVTDSVGELIGVAVSAGSGDDTIKVGHGNHIIDAGDGRNKVTVKDGNHTITAGSGDDTIKAGHGNHVIDAGDGQNKVIAKDGNHAITTGSGDDTIKAGHGDHVIDAGDGQNKVIAKDGNHTITTGDGDDTVKVRHGDNTITTGSGDDKIKAGDGANTVDAGEGKNKVTTGNGDDTITTGDGDDRINAGHGDNTVNPHEGSNIVLAGRGDDTITTGSGDDTVKAGHGNNVIDVGEGEDTVITGNGDDTITSVNRSDDALAAGTGTNLFLEPDDGFNITYKTTGPMSQKVQRALFAAAERWSQIIIEDLPEETVDDFGAVDDLLIDVTVDHVDGHRGILAFAGPDTFREGSHLPSSGSITIDRGDQFHGRMVEIAIHEIAHVLGLGTLWDQLGLVVGLDEDDPLFGDPQYIGPNAVAEYSQLTGQTETGVPVANTGGPGTFGGHWRESVFGNELMTGFINAGSNLLSRLSIAQFADLGYTVDLDAADPYSLSQPSDPDFVPRFGPKL